MKGRDVAPLWLRERADKLRAEATRVEDAFQGAYMHAQCARVARAYRRAAVLLDDEAQEMEAGRIQPGSVLALLEEIERADSVIRSLTAVIRGELGSEWGEHFGPEYEAVEAYWQSKEKTDG